MKKINLKEVFHSRKKALILLAFVAIIVGVLIFNWLYFEEMLSENRTANNRQEEVVKIAQQMQETSDSLAYLVRNYVFTGDIQYFEDYWSMELHGEGREDVVKKLRSYHFDNEEHKNLNIILDRCDELKKQEVYAMWLALAQYHVHAIDYADEELQGYIRYVENYDKLPMHEDRNEPVMGQKQDAIDYLSGEEYSYCTQQLFNAIDEFVSQEQNKLDNIAQQNRSISNRAILFQGMCIILVIVCIVLIFLQNHKMYSLRSLNANIVSAVSEEYRLIALVNLKTHQVTCLKDSMGDWEKDGNTAELGEIFDKYMNNQVAVAYQDQYIRTVQPQNIIRKFDEGQAVVSCLYKNNADEWIMLDITKSQEYSKQNPIVVFTYKNAGEIIQQQKEQRQRDEMLMYFSRDFFEVYVVDLKQGSYEIIRSAERYGNYIKNLTGDFVQLMELAIVSWTKPPYRDMFRQLIDMEDIKKQFDTGTKKIEFIYESYDEKWKSLQCFPVPEYGPGNEKMIFALQDYTEEMQIRTNEVLASEAMNSIYTLVVFRDYEANRYECIHSADKFLSELPDKGNYDDLRQYILSIIHDDDREKYLSEISDEKFNREGRAECEFRLKDKDDEYHYYHEYITRVEVPSGSRMVILVKNIDESKMHEIYKAEQLQKEMTSAYVGIDPTADSLHIGHLVSVMMLKHLQRAGHRPIALVGGATGMIGDPSMKSAERNLLDEATLRHNQESIKKQLSKFLDFDSDAPNAAKLVNNYDWMKEYTFLNFIRDIGKHLTVNYMMAKDSVKKRLSSESSVGMSFTEFSYQLLQGYDFLFLYQNEGCRLQMGGSDQWGNITTGTELIRRKTGGEAFALTCPLITKADGGKFGKTESGNVWLDRRYTSPYKFYQFWLNVSDADAARYIKIFTDLSKEEIAALEEEQAAAAHLRPLQKRLAKEITVMVHSLEDYEAAVEASNILFGNSTHESLMKLDEDTLLAVFEGVPQFEISRDELSAGVKAIDLLTEKAAVFASKGEMRKLVQSGGIGVNKEKLADAETVIDCSSLLNEKYLLVQRGKKNYYLLIAK